MGQSHRATRASDLHRITALTLITLQLTAASLAADGCAAASVTLITREAQGLAVHAT